MTRSLANNTFFLSLIALSLSAPATAYSYHHHHHARQYGGSIKRSGPSVPSYSGFTLSFADDFTGTANTLPSSSNWLWDIGTSYPGGPDHWGTGEIQTYVKSTDNSYVDGNGNLIIVPIKSSSGSWTSSRLETVQYFQCPTRGKMLIEAKIKLPTTDDTTQSGIWPAFWAMGKSFRTNGYSGWPYTGELDIMEAVNGKPTVYNTAHCDQAPGGACNEYNGIGHTSSFTLANYHTFGLLFDQTGSTWQSEFISWQLDGVEKFRITGSTIGDQYVWGNLTRQPVFILLNVALGGGLPNAIAGTYTPNSDTVGGLDSAMTVDYVAVYTSTTSTKTTTTTTKTTTKSTTTTVTAWPTPSSGTVANCKTFAFFRAADTCDTFLARNPSVTKANLIKWNALLKSDCSGLADIRGHNICINAPAATTTTVTAWPTPSSGTIANCKTFAFFRAADTCSTFLQRNPGVTQANLIKWNTLLKSDCSGLSDIRGHNICIAVSTATTTVSAWPTPSSGTIAGCKKFAFFRAADTCSTFLARYPGVTQTNLIKWNTLLKSDCSGLSDIRGHNICIGV